MMGLLLEMAYKKLGSDQLFPSITKGFDWGSPFNPLYGFTKPQLKD